MSYDPFGSVPSGGFRSYLANRQRRQIQTAGRRLRAQSFRDRAASRLDRHRHQSSLTPAWQPTRQEAESEDGGPGDWPIVGGVLQGAGTLLSGVLREMSRPAAAIAGGFLESARGGEFGTGVRKGFLHEFEEIPNFATVLEEVGWENEWARNITGFMLDVVTDPLNLLSFGAIRRPLQAIGGAGLRASQLPRAFAAGTAGDRMVTAIGTRVARTVQRRIGDVTPYELRRGLRRVYKGDPDGDLKAQKVANWHTDIWRMDTQFKVGGLETDVSRAVKSIHRHTVDFARESGLDSAAAKKRADDFVTSLIKDKGENDLSRRIVNTLDGGSPTGVSGVDVQRGRVAWDDATNRLEREFRDEALTPGLRGVVRFLRHQYDPKTPKLEGDDLMRLSLEAPVHLKWELLGVQPQKYVYLHRYFGDRQRIDRLMGGAGLGEIGQKRAISGASVARKADAGLEEMEDNLLAIVATDAAQTKQQALVNTMMHGKQMKLLGGRSINRASAGKGAKTLSEAGLNEHVVPVLQAYKRGATLDEATDMFMTAVIGGRKALPSFMRKERTAIRNVLKATARDGERSYRPWSWRAKFLGQDDANMAELGLPDEMKSLFKKRAEEEWLLPDIAARMFETMTDPIRTSALLGAVDAFNAMWKPTVTVLFPGFFVRNEYGLAQNAWSAGFNLREQLPWNVRAAQMTLGRKLRTAVGGENPTVQRIKTPEGEFQLTEDHIQIMRDRGLLDSGTQVTDIIEGGTTGRVANIREAVARGTMRDLYQAMIKGEGPRSRHLTVLDSAKGAIDNYGKTNFEQFGWNPVAYGSTLNQWLDNKHKLAGVMWRISKGDTLDEAIDWSANTYFRYSDAAGGIFSVVPFGRWTRFNVPFQLSNILTAPARVNRLGMMTRTLEKGIAEVDPTVEPFQAETATLPDYILERHNVVLGKNEDGSLRVIYGFGLPIEDINRVFALGIGPTLGNLLGDITPILKLGLEVAVGGDKGPKSFFTNEFVDDPAFSNYFSRAWAWQEYAPGINKWLQIERQEDPKTGKVRWRTKNPMAMYFMSSFIGRFGHTADQLERLVIEPRDRGLLAINILSGVKLRNIFPLPDPEVSVFEAARDNPIVAREFDEYRGIAVYPQFNDADLSRLAVSTMASIRSAMRFIESAVPGMSEDERFERAAQQVERTNTRGVFLARQVRRGNWRATGGAIRREYLLAHPLLRGAIEGLSPGTQEQLIGDRLGFDPSS
jgi:hypothetical protein